MRTSDSLRPTAVDQSPGPHRHTRAQSSILEKTRNPVRHAGVVSDLSVARRRQESLPPTNRPRSPGAVRQRPPGSLTEPLASTLRTASGRRQRRPRSTRGSERSVPLRWRSNAPGAASAKALSRTLMRPGSPQDGHRSATADANRRASRLTCPPPPSAINTRVPSCRRARGGVVLRWVSSRQ